jgi:hypothetical protein
LCIDAWLALQDKMRPNQGRRQALPKPEVDVEDSGDNASGSDLEEEGGFVDLDLMPVKVE